MAVSKVFDGATQSLTTMHGVSGTVLEIEKTPKERENLSNSYYRIFTPNMEDKHSDADGIELAICSLYNDNCGR